MTWTLVVTSHGRWPYLMDCLNALDRTVGLGFFDRRVLSLDGCQHHHSYPAPFEVLSTDVFERQGLTANLAQAWGSLGPDDEWVFHVEEDFLVLDAPLEEMAGTLDAYRQVANMVLVRQPWGVHEIAAGSVLAAQRYLLTDRGGWLEHEGGFWLNPMVAHASLLRSLQPGVEESLTAQCRERGLSFGYWGGRGDGPRCAHIGEFGGMGSPGWKP